MTVIVNTIWTIKPDKKSAFIAELSTKLPATRAYDGCEWFYLVDSPDSNPLTVEAVSMWEAKKSMKLMWLFEQIQKRKMKKKETSRPRLLP